MQGNPFTLFIVPIGSEDHEVVQHLSRELEPLGASIVVEERVPTPQDAYDRRRDQYLARPILRLLGAFAGDKTLGITDIDLYASGLRFVFGQAEAPGRTAIISMNRLRWGVDDEAFLERCVKEATHELGHTFGLKHCDDPGCVMHYSVSLADTDAKGRSYCESCAPEFASLRDGEASKRRGRRVR